MIHFDNSLSDGMRDDDEPDYLCGGFYGVNQVSPRLKNLYLCESGLKFFHKKAETFRKLPLKSFLKNNVHPDFYGMVFDIIKQLKTDTPAIQRFTNISIRSSPFTPYSMHVVCIKQLPSDSSRFLFEAIPLQMTDQIQKKLNRLQDECNFRKKYKDRFILLTPREKRILIATSQGESSKEIADHLFISTNTVETHKKNIQRKIGGKKKDFILFALSFDLINHLFKKYI